LHPNSTYFPYSKRKKLKNMGLFSFLKAAGSTLFGGKAEANDAAAAAPAAADNNSALVEAANRSKAAQLITAVSALGLKVENFDVVVEGDKATLYGQVDTTSVREKVVLIVGNTAGISTVDDRISVINDEPEATFYTVKKGDSLSKIAKEVYGDMMKYPVIFDANKPMLTSPDLIYPGQVLRIPAL
jgi:nucleoid-associated protein YgaU